MTFTENVLLAPLTTLHIGGRAQAFVEARTDADALAAFAFARERGLPVCALGGGSNVLIPDEGVRGVVVKVVAQGISLEKSGGRAVLAADAGASWDEVVERAVAEQVWGIENLSGIPGTVGGAVVQNIGAYGAALSDVLQSVDVYDDEERAVRTLTASECALGYRTSICKKTPGRYLVLRARLALSSPPRPNLAYRDLAARFGEMSAPSLTEVREAVLEIRKGKFPDRARYGTAGSFFLNPVLDDAAARAIVARFPGMPLFPLPEGGVKVPIAWILDYRHGIIDLRDARVGKAFVWPAQPLVIATELGACAEEVERLAGDIAERVRSATGISLVREVTTLN
jgi:UDP-N-acetylmuramate dehydrogenase